VILQCLKRLLFFTAASFSFIALLLAQDTKQPESEVYSHKAYIRINPESQELQCRDTVTLHRVDPKPDNVLFRMMPFFKVQSITIGDDQVDFEQRRDSVFLEDVPSDTVVDIIFEYGGTMKSRTDFSGIQKHLAVLREEEFLPYLTRAYRLVRFSIEVPFDWETIAPGALLKVDSLTTTRLFVWEFTQPLPMIGWICAGTFKTASKQCPSTRINTYLYSEDSAESSRIISLTDSVVQFYSSMFTRYRFPQLSIVEVDDWVAGRAVLAIAVPSFIMVKKMAFNTEDEFNRYPLILPHETAHQWWPATVFSDERDAALLSEGMCEYSARLYSEHTGTLTSRDSLNSHPLLRSLINRSVKGLDIPL